MAKMSALDRYESGFQKLPRGTFEIPPAGSKIRILQKQVDDLVAWATYAFDANAELTQRLAGVTKERDDMRAAYEPLKTQVHQLEQHVKALSRK